MKPIHTSILDITYHRPGITKVKFVSSYGNYSRRGTMVYDTVKCHFLSHTSDITILDAICSELPWCSSQRSI
jgi:hypothetical protein